MYRETLVKKPRKVYRCETCGEEIAGEHIYTAQVWEGDFHTSREHVECVEYRNANICFDCYECTGLSTDCFYYNECDRCDRQLSETNECDINYRECILRKWTAIELNARQQKDILQQHDSLIIIENI